MPRRRAILTAGLLAAAFLAEIGGAAAAPPPRSPGADSLYTSRHPRLFFSRGDLPALRAKVHDGGPDDTDYAFIRNAVDSVYAHDSLPDLMSNVFGMNFLLETGLVSHIEDPPDPAVLDLGRTLTLAVTDSFAPDDNVFYSPVRMRILSFGYDMCMDTATPAERDYVRGEIAAYIDSAMTEFNYERWLHRPYTSNITAMIGSALGIAAICLSDELPPATVDAALARADTFVATWERYLLDPDGSYNEGVQYAAWSLEHVTTYFAARKRYDGTDRSRDPAIRAAQRWLAYEILPEPGGPVNNLNDTAYQNWPLVRHGTYINWALSAYSSGLAAWIWDRVFGPYKHDWGLNQDRASTVLWWRPVQPVDPSTVLPHAFLWKHRGLYYYRTGWPKGDSSDDVVFSFYSGKFQGGHTHADQNNFTLYAFGTRFAADNGYAPGNWQSVSHNAVFVDGHGEHDAGTSYGTDGRMAASLLSDYGDYLFGDATDAYAKLSPFDSPGVPFPGDDWSIGDTGRNPVLYACRRWLVVHEGATPPYFVMLDDVKKDDMVRTYDWRMHTEGTNTVELDGNLVRITAPRGGMDIDVMAPSATGLRESMFPYTNPSDDPDTKIVVLSNQTDAAHFALVLRPLASGAAAPQARPAATPWGGVDVLDWPGGPTDLVVANPAAEPVSVVTDPAASRRALDTVTTDARLAQLRFTGKVPGAFMLTDVTRCDVGSTRLVCSRTGAFSVVSDGHTLWVDRPDAAFSVYGPGVTRVRWSGGDLSFNRAGDFVSRAEGSPRKTPSALRVLAYPVPFSGALTVTVAAPALETGSVAIYDVAGRRVRDLWRGTLVPGRTYLTWDGRGDDGVPIASGVYFVRADAGGFTNTAKVVRVR